MQVILKESLHGKGRVGEIVEVSDGYARNFLCPQGKAMPVNETNIEQVKAIVAEVEKREKESRNAAEKIKEKILKEEFSLTAKVKEADALYGSLNVADIQKLIEEKGYEIDKRDIHLIGGSIKSLGEYTVKIELYQDICADVTVKVVADKSHTEDE